MHNLYSMYPWMPFFKELASSLLKFRDDRGALLNWLRIDLSDSMGRDKKKLGFCSKLTDPSRKDIDPFSVISILCRKYHFESAEKILKKYKDFFQIQSNASSSDWGLITFNNDDFLFSNNESIIETLWIIFEKALHDEDFSNEYNIVASYKNSYYYLTHVLSWICPEKFLALNGPVRDFLRKYNISVNEPPTYERYMEILDKVKLGIDKNDIPCSSLLQLVELVQKDEANPKMWFIPAPKDIMIYGKAYLSEYVSKQKKKERDLFYNKVIPRTDFILLYESINENDKECLRIYGWGRFNSKKLRLDSNMLSEIEWHPYVENGITWDYSEQTGIFKLNANTRILEKFRIDKQDNTTCMKTTNYNMYIDLLEKNKNLILTGAPGTGKTYMAKAIAAELMEVKDIEELTDDQCFGFVQFHPSYDYTDFVEGLRPTEENGQLGFKRKDGVFKVFCKKALSAEAKQYTNITKDNAKAYIFFFKDKCNGKELLRSFDKGSGIFTVITHWDAPIYAIFCVDKYSTPVPVKVSEDKIIEYLTNPQINSCDKDQYEEAIADYINEVIIKKKKKCVFIIDEINRGEISKIFGELFFSIDPDYRGKKGKVNTQYQNLIPKEGEKEFDSEHPDEFRHGFYVPENVYIIGTMNDIDRSVESMDFAMRRRFYFQQVTAEESYHNMIENEDLFVSVKEDIKKRMFSLNTAIAKTDGLNEAYQIGAAYFRKYLDYKDEEKPFECLWNNHIKGLLLEYLRGCKKKEELLENLYKAYNLEDNHE